MKLSDENAVLLKKFENYLRREECTINTILTYTGNVERHFLKYGILNKKTVIEHKNSLMIQGRKPKGINVYLSSVNKFLFFKNKNRKDEVKCIKVQRTLFCDNVISMKDYKKLLEFTKEKKPKFYYILRTLAATGVRISELLKLRCEDVEMGYAEIISKGVKARRVYFPKSLIEELRFWIDSSQTKNGVLFKITSRGVANELKKFAEILGINKRTVYPHSFRHFFAKEFLKRSKDLSLLCDLMGHSSINTTQIYLRKTANEQQRIVNRTIDW